MQSNPMSMFVMIVLTYSAQVCAVQQPPTTWGVWRPHRGPACPWQKEGPPPKVVQPPRNHSPTPTPMAKVVRPPPMVKVVPPMVKVVQPPMKKARAEEHPWTKKEARAEEHPAEEYSQEEMGKWEAWADEAVRRANKNADEAVRRANKNAETEKLAEEAVAPDRRRMRVKRIVRVKKVRPVGADAEENVDGDEADGSDLLDKEKEAPDDEHAHVEGGLLDEVKREPTADDEHAHVEEGLDDDELAHVEGLHGNEHVHVEGLHDVEHVHVEGLHVDEHAHVEGPDDGEYSPATTTMDDEQEHFEKRLRDEYNRVEGGLHDEADDERKHVEGGLHDERQHAHVEQGLHDSTTEEERKWYGGCLATQKEEDDADALLDIIERVVAWNKFKGIGAGAEEHGEEEAASCTHEVVDDAEEHGEEEAATSCTRLVVDDAEEHVQEKEATSCTHEAVDAAEEHVREEKQQVADVDTESSNDTSTHTYGPDRSSEYETFEECEDKLKETGLPPPSTFLSLFQRIPSHRG